MKNLIKTATLTTLICVMTVLTGQAQNNSQSGRPVPDTDAKYYKYNSAEGFYYDDRQRDKSIRDTKTGLYFSVGVGGGLNNQKNRLQNQTTGASISGRDTKFDVIPVGKLGYILPYPIMDGDVRVALELDGSYFETVVADSYTSGIKLRNGCIAFVPQISIPMFQNRVRTYFGAGPALVMTTAESPTSFTPSGNGFEEDDILVGFMGKLGSEYYVFPWMTVFAEYAYLMVQDFDLGGSNTQIYIEGFDSHQFRLGMGFHF